MRFPWVSRERLDEAQKEIARLREENAAMIERLLDQPEPRKQVSVEEDKADGVSASNPIDRVLVRFDRAPASEKARFKARMR